MELRAKFELIKNCDGGRVGVGLEWKTSADQVQEKQI